jgi:hypothetical protein
LAAQKTRVEGGAPGGLRQRWKRESQINVWSIEEMAQLIKATTISVPGITTLG